MKEEEPEEKKDGRMEGGKPTLTSMRQNNQPLSGRFYLHPCPEGAQKAVEFIFLTPNISTFRNAANLSCPCTHQMVEAINVSWTMLFHKCKVDRWIFHTEICKMTVMPVPSYNNVQLSDYNGSSCEMIHRKTQ